MILSWRDDQFQNQERVVTELVELRSLLQSIAAKTYHTMPIVDVIADDGQSASIGVGAAETAVTYQVSVDGPYFVSRGNETDGESVWFDYHGSASEYPREWIIPTKAALAAIEQFFQTGTRPTTIGWIEL